MDEETIELLRSTAWTKASVAIWSGIPPSELRLSQKLTSPPFPSNRELLRQIANGVFKDRDPNYTDVQRTRWQAAITANSTIRDVRDLCHANR